MRFSDQLRQAAGEVWAAQHEHPFVCGIHDGTLDPERFRFYLRQDYLFLIEYARLLALACARAATRADGALRRAGAIDAADRDGPAPRPRGGVGDLRGALERERPRAVTRSYTDFLLRTAAMGDFGELVAALLPCMWGYSELGQQLARASPLRRGVTDGGSRCTPGRLRQPGPLVPAGLRRGRRRRGRGRQKEDAGRLPRKQPLRA